MNKFIYVLTFLALAIGTVCITIGFSGGSDSSAVWVLAGGLFWFLFLGVHVKDEIV